MLGIEENEEIELTRTFAQIEQITAATRAGIPMQIEYAQTENLGMESAEDYVRRKNW